jgi:hypothetical protein
LFYTATSFARFPGISHNLRRLTSDGSARFSLRYCAKIRIRHFLTARLSADDRQIAMLNTAFQAFSGLFRHFYSLTTRP